ncbi:hypothetical protein K8T06_07340 [bacterium]|nr:hypothetical protein [bacterium]
MRKHTYIILVPVITFILCWTLLTDATEDEPGTLEYLELFSQCFELIQSRYLEPTNPAILAEGAVEGMLLDTSPYAALIPNDGWSRLIPPYGPAQLGVVIGFSKPMIRVIDVIPGSVAEQIGILPGDSIIRIGDKVTPFLSIDHARRMLSGNAGDHIEILTQNHLTMDVKELDIELQPVLIESGVHLSTHEGIRLARITGELSELTIDQLNTELTNQPALPTILDLRHLNMGNESLGIRLADIFIEDGKEILATCDNNQQILSIITSKDGVSFGDFPIVVIIDKTCSGPAETCASALQNSGRASITGDCSFGKAVQKETHILDEKHTIQMVTGWYCTPAGKPVHYKGVSPDIPVQLPIADNSKDPYIKTAIAQFQKAEHIM